MEPQPVEPRLLDLALFCIGSPGYRAAKTEFVADKLSRISAVQAEETAMLCAAHLDALFIAESASYFPQNPGYAALSEQLADRVMLRDIVYRNLTAELSNLIDALHQADPDVPAIALKGPAIWPYYGDAQQARRTRDLDLLIGHPSDGDVLCDVLESLGFQSLAFEGDPRTAREHIWEYSGFSAPPMRIYRQADIGPYDSERVRKLVQSSTDISDVEWSDERGLVLTLDVELHMALMRAETGRLLRHRPGHLVAQGHIPGLWVLSTGAMLAFTAAKLSVDIVVALKDRIVEPKCLKLAADFLRLLQSASQDDFEDAFRVAQQWDCLHHLVSLLRSVGPLVPEMTLGDLPASQEAGLFDLFLASLVDDRKMRRHG